MTAHISLAKAAFGASLLRQDVTKVSRDDLPVFHEAFEAVLLRCSNQNIQACKQWLGENVMVSQGRTAAFGKYLVTLSRHLAGQQNGNAQTVLPSRQRLHMLYLVNDLFHHGKYHLAKPSSWIPLSQSLEPFLPELFQLASSDAKARVSRRLSDLIQLWEKEKYFGQTCIAQLKGALAGMSVDSGHPIGSVPKSNADFKEAPYLLPPTHGDVSLPYHDLPAGNFMRYIVPNSLQPMRADEIRALQLSAGPADESLINALKDFLKDVDGIENSLSAMDDAGLSPEIDELGQISYQNEAGDLIGDTYYGWSRAFCDKMKKRGRRSSSQASHRSRSTSTDRSRSMAPRKRRRHSSSSPAQSRSSISNRSASRHRYGGRRRDSDLDRERTRSRSQSLSSRYPMKISEDPKIERSRSQASTHFSPATRTVVPPPPSAAPALMGMPFPPPPFGPTSIAVPPPRPPQWVGPWPPPPPPPFHQVNAGYSNLPFPPPPPPPNYASPGGSWPASPNAPAGQNNNHFARRQ